MQHFYKDRHLCMCITPVCITSILSKYITFILSKCIIFILSKCIASNAYLCVFHLMHIYACVLHFRLLFLKIQVFLYS